MTEESLAAGQAPAGLPGATPQAADDRTDPMVHYSYLALAMLLYGTLAGWSLHHVNALARPLEIGRHAIPAFSKPLFGAVTTLGALLFLPLGALVLAEIVMPRRLTRVWLLFTLALVLLGFYVAIALWLPARGATTQ
ncbi:MAG: hypothetical protein FD180_3113 [Planctomycetota bacterium]|nr:MAG: hypothetical protein FD180_3113 [Planctomycetota bacterium]